MKVDISNVSSIFKDCEKKIIKACVATVNVQAAETRKNAIENVKQNFTLRNNFTERSITFQQCPKSVTKLEDIQSEVGALTRADYLERLEKGGERKPKSGTRLAIPTSTLRGGNSNLIPRASYVSKVVQKKVKGSTIHRTVKSAAVARAYMAHKLGLFMSFNKSIFRVTSFQKNGDNIKFKKEMIYNMKHFSTKTPAEPWLEPATIEPIKNAQNIFNFQADKIFIEGK